MVDEDRSKGSAKKIEGQVKEKAGQALGDKKTEREGRQKQTEGEAQNTWGSVKDTVREKT
ncbi:MAG TPA: CsbD family protein [Geminicoccaceae bacterium]